MVSGRVEEGVWKETGSRDEGRTTALLPLLGETVGQSRRMRFTRLCHA